MRLYKIYSPAVPAAFRTAEREAKDRARELGINGRIEPMDVGTTKGELVPFLEELAHTEFQRGSSDGHAEHELEAPIAAADAGAASGDPNRCAKCKSRLIVSAAGADKAAFSRDIDKIAEWTDGAPTWALERLTEILQDRAQVRGQGRAH